MTRKTADANERATYKAAVLDLQTVLHGLQHTRDKGLQFWRDELTAITARHLVKLGAVEATRQHYKPESADAATVQLHAATVAADAARRSLRTAKREDREDAKEAWGRLEAAEARIATLTSEIEYWRDRCTQAEGFTIDGPPVEDPRVVAAFADCVDVPF